jgi:hypothetical protein
MMLATHLRPSWPVLTRPSKRRGPAFSRALDDLATILDGRVKPGHDAARKAASAATGESTP